MSKWNRLECCAKDLQLHPTLGGGQCFRWHKNEADEWTGIFSQRIWILKQTDDSILYKVVHAEGGSENIISESGNTSKRELANVKLPRLKSAAIASEADDQENKKLLFDYFRLDVPLDKLYKQWSNSDPNFKKVSTKFHGVRMLKQDPTENIFSFICSSNNHISRISSMVEKLCSMYGPLLATVDGKPYHGFPEVESLADSSVEQVLRDSGFGYRSKFIQRSAETIKLLGGQAWLQSLQEQSYKEAKSALMELPGIGAKVADCICLMSLGHLEAIPVDTHVWKISCEYLPHLRTYKSVTDRVYNEIGDYFRNLYGTSAGWAHTVLFCADLKMFQDRPTAAVQKRKIKSTEVKRKKIRS